MTSADHAARTEHAEHADRADHAWAAMPAKARQLQGQRAGVVTRVIASVVDTIVVCLIMAAIYGAVVGVLFLINPSSWKVDANLGWSIPVLGAIIAVPYLALCWSTTGRSYGDFLLGLRVVNFRGDRMNISGATLRSVFCVFFPIGLFWTAVSPANRSVQDLVLRSSVIYDWMPRPSSAHVDVRD